MKIQRLSLCVFCSVVRFGFCLFCFVGFCFIDAGSVKDVDYIYMLKKIIILTDKLGNDLLYKKIFI